MSTAWIGVIAALGGALIGASASIVQIVLSHMRESGKRYDSLLVTALTFLSGNETERSSGISVIEGVFANKKGYVKILVPALTSQAVYLLLHTEAASSRTEFYNWLRIMDASGPILSYADAPGGISWRNRKLVPYKGESRA